MSYNISLKLKSQFDMIHIYKVKSYDIEEEYGFFKIICKNIYRFALSDILSMEIEEVENES